MSNSSDTRRFGGIKRLYGNAGFDRLASAHVCVIGVGGVGSWCCEALARTCVGSLTLIDGDTVGESNINRQLPALGNTLGRAKVEVLAERFASINPDCRITTHQTFISKENFEELIPKDAIIVDAIDSMAAKAALVAWARDNGRTIFVAAGAGGRTDPSRVKTADIALANGDPLLSKLRTTLRKEYGFPAGHADPKRVKKFGIKAIYTDEPSRGCAADALEEAGAGAGFGTSMVATATLGLRIAACVIEKIVTPEH